MKSRDTPRPYVRIDNDLGADDKLLEVDESLFLSVCGLHVLAIGYCDRKRTDGFVPRNAFRFLAPAVDPRVVDELVRVGLWEEKDGGYQIHAYLDWQKSKTDIEELSRTRRAAARRSWASRTSDTRDDAGCIAGSSAGCNADTDTDTDTDTEEHRHLVEFAITKLNAAAGTRYRVSSKRTRKLIHTRMDEGFTAEDFETVIDNKVAAWRDDPKMSAYLRPETLFGPKFESYLNAKPRDREEVTPDGVPVRDLEAYDNA